ncbi:MAG TPA: hypothetical protein VIY29_03990 [Ktedonobacteraceae bacterium]
MIIEIELEMVLHRLSWCEWGETTPRTAKGLAAALIPALTNI